MKGYNKPKKLELGICCVCKNQCKEDAYCHTACAMLYLDEKERLVKESKWQDKGNQT